MNFIRSIFNKLDAYIDVDFTESADKSTSILDIYSLNDYSLWSDSIVGQVNDHGSGSTSRWDIYWRDTNGAAPLDSFDKNTIIHEIGHALGLSHPNEDPTNPNWNTKDTVMSYNPSQSGWDFWFSEADILALQDIWGVENDYIKYSTINTAGEVAFQQDSGTGLYAVSVNGGDSIAITWNGKQIHEGIYGGWQTLAAANINGTNTVLWKNTRGNYLHTWSLDNNWQRFSGQGQIALNSSAALSLETDFNIDLNGDSQIGANYSTINSAGDVAFQKDSSTGLYAVSVNGGDSIAITWNGKQIHEGIYGGWQTLAAANINGTNTVLWKNTRGNYLHTWSLDNNWQRFSGQGQIALNSSAALSLETDFNIDLNGDSQIGANYSTINSAGDVAFQKDSSTGLYAVSVNGGDSIAITWNGKQIHEGIYGGWQTLAAANINGTNTVLWKNTRGNYLHTWSLDNNWQRFSGQGQIALNSSAALSLETDFNIDLNGDSQIGANYSTINTAGEVAFQQDSGTGLYAVSVNGGDSIAITWNGKQIHEGIYGGWQTLAAANINGTNTVLWKNTRGNYLHTWSLDNNWQRFSGQGQIALNSSAALSLETDFNIDLNGDSQIGANYSTINSAGDVAFQKDSSTGLYAVSVNGGDSIAITWNGKQIHEGIYGGWQTLAAANINGTNTVLWKNTRGNYLHTWSLDNNWQRFSGQGQIALNSSAALSLETDFNIDLNGDSLIGEVFNTRESEGDIDLLTGLNDLAFARDAEGVIHSIFWNGEQIGDQTWLDYSVVAAENINGENQFVIKHAISDDLKIFSASGTWEGTSYDNIALGSSEYLTAEKNYGVDFNNDNLIGQTSI